MDECPYQVISEAHALLPAKPGQPECHDYEYQRQGTCKLFMFVRPHLGWRHVKLTKRRTKQDFAYALKDWVDIHFPEADVSRLVVDNLNTQTPAVLDEVFDPAEARRIARKLEFHDTPKHGSWLNLAEIEFALLSSGCLARRFPDVDTVRQEVAAWERKRNDGNATIDWQFTTDQARLKLHRVYPS